MSQLWEVDSLSQSIAYKVVYGQMAGDTEAGLLLSQIMYWFRPGKNGKTKLKVQKAGKFWLAKSRVDWTSEIGLTPKQYDRAVKKLLDKKIIQVQRFVFAGKVTPHIWLDEEQTATLMVDALLTISPKWENPFSQNEKIHFPDLGKSLQETTKQETTTETIAGKPASSHLDLEWVLANPKAAEQQLKTTFTANWWKMKAREILAAHANGELRAKDIGNGTRALEMLWKRRMATEYPEYIKAFTKQEIGQMRMFVQKVGPRAPDVLDFALTNWPKFAGTAAADAGIASWPQKPQVGFLLAHHGTALGMVLKKEQQAAQELSAPSTPPVSTPVPIPDAKITTVDSQIQAHPTKITTADSKPISADDLLAMMASKGLG